MAGSEIVGGGGNLLAAGVIQVDGDVSGYLKVESNAYGVIYVSGAVQPTGQILVGGKLTGSLSVGGDVGGTVQVGEISGTGIPFGSVTVNNCSGTVEVGVMSGRLTVNQDLSGVVRVTNRIEGITSQPLLEVRRNVTWTGVVDVADILGSASLEFGTAGAIGELEFTGRLLLQSGLKQNQTLILFGALNYPGFLDLNGQGVAGHIDNIGGGTGDIINGGAVSGSVELGFDLTSFQGSATFASVEAPL